MTDEPYKTSAAMRVFSGVHMEPWLRACRKLAYAGYGAAVLDSYVRNAVEVARLVGPERAIALVDGVSSVAIKSGVKAAEVLPAAAVKAAVRLDKDEARFRSWLGLMERCADLAPESMFMILAKMDTLLSQLNVSRLEAWILTGIRSAGADPQKRVAFFSFENPQAERWLNHESGSVVYSEMDRELRAYMAALWGIRVPMREPSVHATAQAQRRAGFGPGHIRVPSSYPGFRGAQAEDLFRAVVAHIGAHLLYSGDPFPVAKLKPVQVALISLIEDARVEQLAMRKFPGLRRLWLPFHIAQATGSLTAPSMMARLSRALIDANFYDGDGWVRRARDMFYERKDDWNNPAISREIGGLIGNDLGQMRVQFNAKTYVPEPPYRDDNLGLWDFGDQGPPDDAEAEVQFDSVDIQEQEDDETSPDREREEPEENDDADVNKVSIEYVEQEGLPVARYPEYDYKTGRSRPDWTTVVEYAPTPGPAHKIDDILEKQSAVVRRITSLITSAKISQPQKINRQSEGDFLDLNASIEAMISRRVGEIPDPQVYGRSERRHRDLSVHVLLDISESTNDKAVGSPQSIIELERQATALLAHAMSGLGDPFAIAAFSSNQRDDVRYHRIKDFGAPYGAVSKSYLAGLIGGYSTRIGAAMRHAAQDLKRQQTHRRLLLVITDGEPSDLDVTDKSYLVEDARHVIHDLAMSGIDVFCVGLDSGGDSYLSRIFGRRNVVQIDKLENLPEKLPMLYFRLTS